MITELVIAGAVLVCTGMLALAVDERPYLHWPDALNAVGAAAMVAGIAISHFL